MYGESEYADGFAILAAAASQGHPQAQSGQAGDEYEVVVATAVSAKFQTAGVWDR